MMFGLAAAIQLAAIASSWRGAETTVTGRLARSLASAAARYSWWQPM